MPKPIPRIAATDAEIDRCFDVMVELRTDLEHSSFVSRVREMEPAGFRLAYLEVDDVIVAVAGFRISTNLALGRNFYIDDLVTCATSRSKGYGALFIDWLRDQAKKENCRFFHLGSGTSRRRAHKFYFGQGFTIEAYAFCELLED
jgi:GNAT superfamily N-acetyltransferase